MKYDILFVYSGGRTDKNFTEFATDFFYGLNEFKQAGYKAEFIELNNLKNKKFDKLLTLIFQLPMYFLKAMSINNFSIMKKSKNIVFINETSFLSFLPFIFILKYFHRKNIIFFPMGLFDKYKKGSIITKSIIKFALKLATTILFIGKGELLFSNNLNPKLANNSFYIPFSIDVHFWNYKKNKSKKLNNILFIGNDLNRDFNFLYKLIESLSEFRFTVVTEYDQVSFDNLSNVKIISGSWRKGYKTDIDIRSFYHNSDLVVLPLKQSMQPSGQSVTLQSLACGTPVLITKTEGFWDYSNFKNNQNIIFVDSTKIYDWKQIILKIDSGEIDLEKISENGRKTIEKKHNLNNFIEELKNYLILNES